MIVFHEEGTFEAEETVWTGQRLRYEYYLGLNTDHNLNPVTDHSP